MHLQVKCMDSGCDATLIFSAEGYKVEHLADYVSGHFRIPTIQTAVIPQNWRRPSNDMLF